MQEFINLIKNRHFYYAKLVTELAIEKRLYKEYSNFIHVQKELFSLIELPEQKPNSTTAYQLTVTIPDYPSFEKKDIENFKKTSDFFEKNFTEKITIFSRMTFHYSRKDFETDPALPVVFEEKRSGFGKVILNGMRISFPEHREVDSIILDIQKCHRCKADDIFLQVLSEHINSYSFGYLKDTIKKSKNFSAAFIKQKENKNA
ncbi:MAG: hypothetical protein JSV30_00195 [Candidatus Omnitrophota bacterium]|nr:MAG: hypothetical protein JSV30_00195 [Candidatus Omnitrophota bacterium]